MGNQLLHGFVIFSILRPPDKACALAGPSYESLCVFRNRHSANRHFIIFRVELSSVVLSEVPDANPAALIPEDDLSLVGVQHCSVDHHTVVIEIPHEAHGFEVKHLQGTVLTRCEEPLVVFLELKRCDVARMSLEKSFLVDDLARAWLRNLVHLDYVVGCDTQILTIDRHGQLVDLGGGGVNRDLH